MTRPVAGSIVSNIVSSIVSAVVDPIKRFFITLDSVLNGFYSLQNSKTFPGDYSVEADVFFTDSVMFVYGKSSNFNNRVFINTGGSIDWRVEDASNSALAAPAASVPVNKLSTIKVVRIGSAGEIFVNGVSVATGVVATGSTVIDQLGRVSTASFSDGIIANVKLTDLATPSNSEFWRLANATENTEQSSSGSNLLTYVNIPTGTPDREEFTFIDGDWLSDTEIVTNGDFSTDTDWTKGAGWSISGGTANSVAVTNTFLQQAASLGAFTHKETLTISNYTSGTVRINAGGGGDSRSSNGVFTQNRLSSGDTFIRLDPSFSSGFVGSADNFSMKRILELP